MAVEKREILFQLRQSTSGQFAARNRILLSGEPAYETDTGRLKIGDGVQAYNDLEYVLAPAGDIPGVGDISDLTTEDKSTLVAAINELNMDGVSLSLLYDNAKAG